MLLLPRWTWTLGAITRFASTIFPIPPMRVRSRGIFDAGLNWLPVRPDAAHSATASSRRNVAAHNGKRQTSPPAMSASGNCCRGAVPRFSMVLYHVMRAAVAVIRAMPIALIMICIPMPPDISTRMK